MASYEKYIDQILPGINPYDFADKKCNLSNMVKYMLSRTQMLFKWDGLPESIPQRSLELYLQTGGFAGIAEHAGNLYAFMGGRGGPPDPYYMPTEFVVANPALTLDKTYKIGVDCVIIPSDSMYTGLLPMLTRYCSALVESELSIWIALINTRLVDVFEAMDDRSKAGYDKMMEDVVRGKLSVIAGKLPTGAIKAFPYANSNTRTMTDLIEITQYIKASLYNELGLNANYNMKRESINSGESQLNDDALFPLVDDMLNMRRAGADAVNAMFGTNITVSLSSAWEDNAEEIKLEQDAMDPDGSPEPSNRLDEEQEDDNDEQMQGPPPAD